MRPSPSLAVAAIRAGIIQVVIVGTLLVLHEMDSGINALFNSLTGHHWLTLSALTVVLFPMLVLVLYRAQRPFSGRLRFWAVSLGVATGLFVLLDLGFYLVEYLAH